MFPYLRNKMRMFFFISKVFFLSFFFMATFNFSPQSLSGEIQEFEEEPWWDETLEEDIDFETAEIKDPLEGINRTVFRFNDIVDGMIFKPAAILYNSTVPELGKKGVNNFLHNIFSPLYFVNYTLQRDGDRAVKTFFRFFINSTVGLFGLVDVAGKMGITSEATSMNETLASWGVKNGPYLVLPLIGPSSFRGTIGIVSDWYINPIYYISENNHQKNNRHYQQKNLLYAIYGVDAVNRRSQLLLFLNDINKNSLDPYTSLRSAYFQKQIEINKQFDKK